MKVIVFGATGMVGRGVLRECLLDEGVTEVLTVGRTPSQLGHAKLREVLHHDFSDFSAIEKEFDGYDACFFCLGVSSLGMEPAEYERITYGFTVAAAEPLARGNPEMVFVYVSGQGTDSSERGRVRWARIKGRTENAVMALFLGGYAFRPGFIQPMHGEASKVGWYAGLYTLVKPLYPVLRRLLPGSMTTTVQLGRAMLEVARSRPEHRILESREINAL